MEKTESNSNIKIRELKPEDFTSGFFESLNNLAPTEGTTPESAIAHLKKISKNPVYHFFVAEKDGMIYFIEVKSVSRPNLREVTRETLDEYHPEDNMHPWKLKRLSRAIQTYLLDKKLDCDWQLDLITVRIDEKNRQARAEIIENIVI